MPEKKPDPSVTSIDVDAMIGYWQQVDGVLAGVDGMRERSDVFLPRFPNETLGAYTFRVKTSKFTNIFLDITENLSQRPFSNPVELEDGTFGQDIEAFIEDVDGQGSTLHGFAGEAFFASINYGMDFILVDYTANVPAGATRDQERRMNARPYWVRYTASSIIAIHSLNVGGIETISHFRAYEPGTQMDGFDEVRKDRVRVIDRPLMEDGSLGAPVSSLWELRKDAEGNPEWQAISSNPMTIGVIPLVPVITGRRMGTSWQIHPPMRGALELQVEHFQQESALKYAKTMAAFPMLAGQGVEPTLDEQGNAVPMPVGPHRVIYAPQGGTWQWIEPSSESLRFLADDIKDTAKELRELGRQPLTAQSGNLTVVTTTVAAEKANSAIQAWALVLRLALEKALALTAMWLKVDDKPKVALDLDFDLSVGDDDGYDSVLALRKGGEISRATTLHEAKRRGILDRQFDPDADDELLLAEIEDEDEVDEADTEDEIDDTADDEITNEEAEDA